MASYYYYSSNRCYYLTQDPLSQAYLAVETLDLFFLLIIAFVYLVSQKRIPSPFKTLKWYNFGFTLLFFITAAAFDLLILILQGCDVITSNIVYMRTIIVDQFLYWISMGFLLATVVLPVCRGLHRLRSSTGSGWTRAARVLVGLFVLFTIIYLALMIWGVQSSIDNYSRSRYRYRFMSDFPQYIDVYAALKLFWFLIIIVGIVKMLFTINRATLPAPSLLRTWVFVLAFSLFAWGFVSVFFAFWNNYGDDASRSDQAYLAENVCMLVLPTFFHLLAFLAVTQVAKNLSKALARSDENMVHKTTRRDGLHEEGYHGVVVR